MHKEKFLCAFLYRFTNRLIKTSSGWLFILQRKEVLAFYFTDTPELQELEREMQKVPNFDRYDDDDEYENPKECNFEKINSY